MKLNDNWELMTDSRQFILTHYYDSINVRTKKPTRGSKTTYHGTLEQVSRQMIRQCMVDCDTIQDMMEWFNTCVELLTTNLVYKRLEANSGVKCD